MFEVEKIKGLFAKYPEIRLGYLFGSSAKGRMSKESDIDIAVLIKPDYPKEQSLPLRLTLMNHLEKIFHRQVEVIILNTAPYLLQYEAMKPHHILYSVTEEERYHYESSIRRLYFDFRFYLQRHSNYFLKKVLDGGLLGAIRRA